MSNIQVVVRCRGRNQQEVAARSPIVLDLTDDTYSITEPYVSINHPSSSSNNVLGKTINSLDITTNASKRAYKFDQVYGSQADQGLVYSHVALPLLSNFLEGTNVSIMAYGQTGTGKTYTMCGFNNSNKMDELPLPEVAGIIPRTLFELFEKLEYMGDDYMVKVSYLEIYNEELTDLLLNHSKKLRIHERVNSLSNVGASRKSISIQNLSELCINNYAEGIKLLKMGFNKKKTATTNMNETSSRSHTIFSIQLYRKDTNDASIYRVSKMNLVDLAGSENISRSGSIVKEAGGINQSLLTLGRVINALNDSKLSQHIPYRESKLTHILQDSLGGGTKTTLIATVSPAQINAMETCSTLDYASKAKNIKNTPQNGHDSEIILKKILVKNLTSEISQLNLDLMATRHKNGIYLDQKSYKNLLLETESLKTQLKESSLRTELLSKKCDVLEQLNIQCKEELSKVLSQNEVISNKVCIIESKLRDSNLQLSHKDAKIDSLTAKLKLVLEKSTNSATMLTSLLSNHLNASVNLLSDTIDMQSNSIAVNAMDEFQKKFQRDLQSFKEDLRSNLQLHNASIQDKVNGDLKPTFDSLLESMTNLYSLHKRLHSNMREVLTGLKVANGKLARYLNEDCLIGIEETIRKKHEKVLQNNFTTFCDNIKLMISNEIEKSILNAVKTTGAATHDELTKQRAQVATFTRSWKSQIDEIVPNIEKELRDSNQVFENSSDKLRALYAKGSQSVESISRETLNFPLDKLPDSSELSTISNTIKSSNDTISQKLQDISSNLTQIQQFDAKSAFEISPLKSKLDQSPLGNSYMNQKSLHPMRRRALSLSPVKSSRALTPSKIPTIKRLNTNVTDDDRPKRRKIFLSLSNVL